MAVNSVQVFQLEVRSQFGGLSNREKRYAHHMARAAWHGTRIILEQVSLESPSIFEFILELYQSCSGDWRSLVRPGVSDDDLNRFLTYAATFLSNVGNYYGSGDQKFVPGLECRVLQSLAAKSAKLTSLHQQISERIEARPPYSLSYPSQDTQSTYYLGGLTDEPDIALVSKTLEENSILPENTRLRRSADGSKIEVLLASVLGGNVTKITLPGNKVTVEVIRGDHAIALELICGELRKASEYTANDVQRKILHGYIESFENGSLDTYRDSLRLWVKDKAPRVESIFGFVEPYRDPHGIRAEFEGLVAIADDDETRLLTKLVENSASFIRRLSWAATENDGKGPFEKSLFEPPDFSSIHALAYCSSIIFPGINLPNYNDIRQEDGFKSVIIANRMAAESYAKQYPFIDDLDEEKFKKHKHPAYYLWVVLHELLGHGTGKMMVETSDGKYNFDIKSPPIHPITRKPIGSWYKPGQTWTGEFGDLATTVDECRAELVGAYLMDDRQLLKLFGFDDTSTITAEDINYNIYQQLGVDGLRGLANFNVDTHKWGQAHSRAHFAILKCLLRDGDGVVKIIHEKMQQHLTVKVDRSKIRTSGRAALGRMLLHLHMFRCTADVSACHGYYDDLSSVNGEFLQWREAVLTCKPPPLVFVHANTFLDGDTVVLKEYEATVEGVIQSWAERNV